MFGSWFRRSAKPTDTVPAPEFANTTAVPPPPPPPWREGALALPEGSPLGEALAVALFAEIQARAALVVPGWPAPAFSKLRVRKNELPDGWHERGNLMLTGPQDGKPELRFVWPEPPSNSLVVIGESANVAQVVLASANGMIVVGDRANMPATILHAAKDSTVIIGADSSSTFYAQVDCRNGGNVLIGEDNMWALGIRMITDDMHTIRDRATGRRINKYGGRIVLAPHVWLGEQVMVGGETRIGPDTVIGAGSFVRSCSLPGHCVCYGRPARVMRTGTTWTRADLP